MECESYIIAYEDEQYTAENKSGLITTWSLLLFDHKGKWYEILAPSGKEILKGHMQASDIKLLEESR